MNLLIFFPEELDATGHAWIYGRRHEHLYKILKVSAGDQLRAGLLNQNVGQARVLAVERQRTLLSYAPDPRMTPPPALHSRLILALPRPPVLRRVLQSATTLGFKEIYLIHSERVEKSYWQSPELVDAKIAQHLLLGLEQCLDVHLPQVHRHERFRPFAEDTLPPLQSDRATYLADPRSTAPCPILGATPCNLMIGPEGGWIPFELDLLEGLGVTTVELGRRILRVETALPYLAGRLQLTGG